MRLIPLILGAALLAAPAKADKFWLSDPDAEANAAAGSSPSVIEGVLLAESDEGYHVRIEGGEILLPKQSVFKIEKDDLDVDAIVKAEKDAKEQGERDNEERRLVQEAAQAAREVQVAEASARRQARAVEASEAAPQLAQPSLDPVLGFVPMVVNHYQLMAQAKANYRLTRDRRYLRELRQLRRLR